MPEINWVCPYCGQFNPSLRGECWHCLTPRFASTPGPVGEREAPEDNAAVYAKLRAWGLLEVDPGGEERPAIDAAEAERVSWRSRLWLFGASLLAFILAGWLVITVLGSPNILGLVFLTATVVLHETGHFLGMRHFGYKNLRMFFVPLFGAAVSGHSVDLPVVDEGIVFLLGPVPGLLIGYLCGLAYFATHVEVWRQAAEVLVLINGVSLLPAYPLDGGLFIFAMLSGRSARFDAALQVLLVLALIGAGALADWPVLVGIGAGLFSTVGQLVRTTRIVHELRAQGLAGSGRSAGVIPLRSAAALLEMLSLRMPEMKSPKERAETVADVWRQANARRPRPLEKGVLLAIYALCLLSLAVARYVYLSQGAR